MKKRLNEKLLTEFKEHLYAEERSAATIEKYLRDIRFFYGFMHEKALTRCAVLEYKAYLSQTYAISSVNSMLAALNVFFRFYGWVDLVVKQFKVQRQAFCSEEKELTRAEYARLVETAKRKNNERLSLIIQTICGCGIRVSELQFITVEAVKNGEARVNCKGKTRRIFIVADLRKKLMSYISRRNEKNGGVFVTRNGKNVSRHNIWRDMKALCREANVSPVKVFPHNLRHLFARTFYGIEKDIAKLADILGHASIETTRIYIVTTGLEHRRKMENMRLIL